MISQFYSHSASHMKLLFMTLNNHQLQIAKRLQSGKFHEIGLHVQQCMCVSSVCMSNNACVCPVFACPVAMESS